MAIAEGEQISVAEIVAFNTTYTKDVVDSSVSVSKDFFEGSKSQNDPYTGTFYIRNSEADNCYYRLQTVSSGNARESKASLLIKDSTPSTVLDLDEDGDDRTVSGYLSLDPGVYTYSGRTYVEVSQLGIRDSQASTELTTTPADISMTEGDTIAIFDSDLGFLESDVNLSAAKANQGRFTISDYPGK